MTPAPTTGGTTLQLRRTVPASREAVFRAWTDPDSLRRWFGAPDTSIPRADLDVRVGGDYRIEMQSPLGTASVFGTTKDSGIMIGHATEVVLTHERQPSRAAHEWHRWGWTHSLERFADLLARTAADEAQGERGADDTQ